MNINDIINEVESPFTEKKIIELIKKFIECNFNLQEFYKNTNKLEREEEKNPYLTELLQFQVFPWETEKGGRLFKQNDYWTIIGSSKEALDVPDKSDKRVPIYRIYINAKGQEKAKIVKEYIKRCEEIGQAYKLKYANKDGRNDEIVILSYGENLVGNIEWIENITEGMNLGEPAQLVGKYKDKIGIGEEFIFSPIYSYTEVRLGMISSTIRKFYIDHLDDFSENMDESIANRIRGQLQGAKGSELLEYYLTYAMSGLYSGKAGYNTEIIGKYMADNFETVIPELLENYHLISEIFGISKNGVFSTRTMEMIEQQNQNKKEGIDIDER